MKIPFGVAWRVIGSWRIAGNRSAISDGDALVPGSLLEPGEDAGDHSITVLLPDGQRILYECFTSLDCQRGFRVPSLYRKPVPTAADLLARVNAVAKHAEHPQRTVEQQNDSAFPRDEAVASIGADNSVEVAGLVYALSDGAYTYVARSLSHRDDKEIRGSFEKHGRSVKLSVPAEGLFDVRIYDRFSTLRIDLLLAATRQPRAGKISNSFHDVEVLLKDWNEDYQGWPVHEFRRNYLRSVMLGIEPAATHALPSDGKRTHAADVTCEPRFNPKPGVFKTDTEVTLQCDTAGAIVHYTVDGSQPLGGATVYRSAIIVKGTALTIKAFASAEGKKDSPVVTGIFRIGD